MQKFLSLMLALLLLAPATVMAASIEDLQKQVQELSEQLDEMEDRVDTTERHVATDRISFYGDLRNRVHTTSQDVLLTPMVDPTNPMLGYTTGSLKEKNDVTYNTRLRLGMKAKIADNMKFNGRLNMYKTWGDSTGVKVMDSWSNFTMDGTNAGNTTGDFLRVERAYFVWNDISESPFYLSIGRRPSTYGAPTNYRENEGRGGTPSGHLVNFNFDGITVGYKLSEHTDVEGQVLRFCYGQGFESQVGNGTLMQQTTLEDTHLGGFNFDVWNDEVSWLQLTAFGAQNISDGFKGLVVMPGTNNVVTRFSPQVNVGSMLLTGVGGGYTTESEMTLFGSVGWNHTLPNDTVSPTGFGGMLSDGGSFNGSDGIGESQDGYSLYIGAQIPAPMGKFGIEYNYGSQYWFSFTQAQDDILGSKLATRGHVGEAYYIFDINPRAFIKLAGLYYDYEYTGSGSILGVPQKISDIKDGSKFSPLPVVENAYDINATITVKF